MYAAMYAERRILIHTNPYLYLTEAHCAAWCVEHYTHFCHQAHVPRLKISSPHCDGNGTMAEKALHSAGLHDMLTAVALTYEVDEH